MHLNRRVLLAAALVLVGTPAFAQSSPPPAAASARLPVVASFSIIGDLARQVGGDRVVVTTIVGPNGDTHVYEPTPADAKKMAAARLVFVNGLGLEGWMDRLIKASGTKAEVVTLTKGIAPRERTADEPQDADEAPKGAKAHGHGPIDPHAWQSVANAKIYVANARDALIAADPAGKAIYEANAASYLAKLTALEAQVRQDIAAVPANRRIIITTHDAFGYFGDAYGLKLLAPQGVSTETEASAKDVSRIIRQIKTQKVPAVFLENVTNPKLLDQIARESGAKVGGKLFSDALSDDTGPAPTYIQMMMHNLATLSAALSS